MNAAIAPARNVPLSDAAAPAAMASPDVVVSFGVAAPSASLIYSVPVSFPAPVLAIDTLKLPNAALSAALTRSAALPVPPRSADIAVALMTGAPGIVLSIVYDVLPVAAEFRLPARSFAVIETACAPSLPDGTFQV